VTPEDPHLYVRKNDDLIVSVNQKLNDFVERSDRDVGAMNERKNIERETLMKWMESTDASLKSQGEILNVLSPIYIKGKAVLWVIVIGSIGLAIKSFWSHILFK
jgi:hypothetical protein